MELQINGGGGLRLKNNHTRTKPEKTKPKDIRNALGVCAFKRGTGTVDGDQKIAQTMLGKRVNLPQTTVQQ